MELDTFMFDNSFFQYNGRFFKQFDGVNMGSPCSPSLSNLAMDYAVNRAINNKKCKVKMSKTLY